jgi:hypothetical protein
MERVGDASSLPHGSRVLGTLPANTRLRVDVVLEPRDPAALTSFANAVANPASPLYHHYLARGQFASDFGPTPATIAAVEHVLREDGLSPGRTSADDLTIPVVATAGSLARAFSTHLERVEVANRVTFANTSPPLMPKSVAGDVQGLLGLDGLVRAVPMEVPTTARPAGSHQTGSHPLVKAAGPTACSAATETAGANSAYTANQIAAGYQFSSLYGAGDEGQGVTVGIFELDYYYSSDIDAYQSCYGTDTTVDPIDVDGGAGDGTGSAEAPLDIEDVIGLAPQATIDVFGAPNSETGIYDNYSAMVGDDVNVITTSWGLCEPGLSGTALQGEEETLFKEAATQGETVFAATGDYGSADCYDPKADTGTGLAVDDPSSQPYVTGVGGTKTTSFGTTPNQSVWDGAGGGGGGGISVKWKMQSYQTDAPSSLNVIISNSSRSPCSATSGYCRETPDVSADANPDTGIVIYYNGAWTAYGGTSIAAPLWASLAALVDADPSCEGTDLGFANPAIYDAAADSYSTTFYDVKTGNNDYDKDNNGLYPATPYYDMASGLGTPNAAGLAAQLCPDVAPSAPSSVSAGAGPTGPPGKSEVQVSWSVPTKGTEITGYTVTPSPACAACGGLTTSSTSTVVTGLTPGTTYTFAVTATDPVGTGPAGTSNNIAAPATPPGAPTSVAATGGPDTSPGDGQITVTWTAAPAYGSAITGYTISPSPACPGTCEGLSTTGAETTVTGLMPGSKYSFTVTPSNSVGPGTPATSNTEAAPATAPEAPTSVSATQGSNATPGVGVIDLNWTAPADNAATISGYEVTPDPSCSSCSGLDTGTNSTIVTGLAFDTPYTFTVTAKNSVGVSQAGTSNSETAPATLPSAPSNVVATPDSSTSINLTWSAAPGNGSSVSGYTITPVPSCVCGGLSTNGATSTTITGVSPGGSYYFNVAAVNSVGTGAAGQSNTAGAPATAPGVPENVTAGPGPNGTAGDGEIALSWTAPPANGADITSYTVTQTSPVCSSCASLTTSKTSITVSGLTPGQPYVFTVSATNSVGAGDPGTSNSEDAPATVPGTTTNVTAKATGTGTDVTVSWTAAAENGAGIINYTVTPDPACAGCTGLTSVGTSTTVIGLSPATSYTFSVAALNSVGAGTAGASPPVITPATAPGAPTEVTATPGPSTTPGDGEIRLSWTSPAPNGAAITQYTVTPSPACTSCGGLTASATSTTVTGLTPAETYSFKVTARNSVGSGPAGLSNNEPAPSTAPGAPAHVVAQTGAVGTPGDGQAHVSWASPAANGSEITGYELTLSPKCIGCGGLTASGTSTTVTGLTPGVAYTFAVTAVNSIGTGHASAAAGALTVYTVPSAPRLVTAKASPAGMVVSFTTPAMSGGSPVVDYTIEPTPACPACRGLSGATASASVTGLTAGTTYRFAVQARNKAGSSVASTPSAAVVAVAPDGYWLAARDGDVVGFGSAPSFGGVHAGVSDPVVGIAATPDGGGYFVATRNGGVGAFGDAHFFGDLPNEHINRTDIVSIVATENGAGYWLIGADGEVYTFGDAPFHGSLLSLPHPVHVSNVVGMVACAGDTGYLLIGSDGGIFAFGESHYYGSLPGDGIKVNDIVGILPSVTNTGYAMVGSDGGAFVFGTGVRYFGSLPGKHIKVNDVVGLALTTDGDGYYMAGSNGATYGFGDAKAFPLPPGLRANLPVAAVAGV